MRIDETILGTISIYKAIPNNGH